MDDNGFLDDQKKKNQMYDFLGVGENSAKKDLLGAGFKDTDQNRQIIQWVATLIHSFAHKSAGPAADDLLEYLTTITSVLQILCAQWGRDLVNKIFNWDAVEFELEHGGANTLITRNGLNTETI